MEERAQEISASKRGSSVEPMRTRWSPKPEQILILESIFNSGMVNPPKDETVKIRKLLENFGPVGDANVFYWFQNRRSRSRRRQRQMQAAMAGSTRTGGGAIVQHVVSSSASPSGSSSTSFISGGFVPPSETATEAGAAVVAGCSPVLTGSGEDGLFPVSRLTGFPESIDQAPLYSPPCASSSHYQSGLMTVFINGIPQEVPRGPIDFGAMFGQDVLLVHYSGEVVPMTDLGILFKGLLAGESYFLIPRHTSSEGQSF